MKYVLISHCDVKIYIKCQWHFVVMSEEIVDEKAAKVTLTLEVDLRHFQRHNRKYMTIGVSMYCLSRY